MKPHTAFLLGALFNELFMFHIDSVSAALNNLECCGRAVYEKQQIDLLNPVAKQGPQLCWPRKGWKAPELPSSACSMVEVQG